MAGKDLQRNVLIPRKKCLNPDCMWIGSTNSYTCPTCRGTSMTSALGQYSDLKMKTIVSYNSHGELIVDNRDSFPNKMDWEALRNGNR